MVNLIRLLFPITRDSAVGYLKPELNPRGRGRGRGRGRREEEENRSSENWPEEHRLTSVFLLSDGNTDHLYVVRLTNALLFKV